MPSAPRLDFGVRDDYPAQLRKLVRGLLDRDETRVVLIPHALSPPGHPESDGEACRLLFESLGEAAGERVELLVGGYRVSEIKELLGRLDWFCGTRMHSTIGALSSGTPAAAMAYSLKFQGVFAQCDMGHRVVPLNEVDGTEGPARLLRAFEEREADRLKLRAALVHIRQQVDLQLESITAFVRCSGPALAADSKP